MKNPIVVAFTILLVTHLGSTAQADELAPPTADPSREGQAASPVGASARPAAESPTGPNVVEPVGASARSAAASPTTPNVVEPVGATARPAAASPTTSKVPEVNKPTKATWKGHRSCQSPDLEDDGFHLSTDCAGVFGLRVSATQLGGVNMGNANGLLAWSESEEYVRRGMWTVRSSCKLGLGGGSASIEGTMFGAWAMGVWLPVSPSGRHGPVLRAGLLGYLRGNDAVYGSLLELPQFQLGYQYQHGKTVVEIGATTGAVLVGRSRIGEAQRRVLGAGFEIGGYAAIQVPWLRLGLGATRLPVNDALSQPVDVAEGTLCGRVGWIAICTDASTTVTNAIVTSTAGATEVRSLYAGLSVGFTRE